MIASLIPYLMMTAFGTAIAIGLLWLVVRLRAEAPGRMQQRLNREIAERTALMRSLADAASDADPAQRARLEANYRYHRARIMALNPNFDARAGDAAFAIHADGQRRAA